MACSSTSYTPFCVFGILLTMCFLCLFLRYFCYMWKSRVRLTPEGEFVLTPENVFILTP